MRVGILLEQCLAPVPGGTGRYSYELAEALARRPDLEVRSWTAWHHDVEAASVPSVDGPRRLPLPRRALVAAWERGSPPRAGRNVDVLHAPTLLAPRRGRRPLVVTVHDAVPWTHPETLTPRGVRWHRKMADGVLLRADLVVVPTSAVADALREHVVVERLAVVGEGVSRRLLALPADATERRRRLGLPASGYLLSLATIEPRKGLDVLLAALADPAAPDLPLVVVGQAGWGGVDPARLADDLGLAQARLRLLGRIPDADLSAVLAGATALVVPSRAEGFGLPVLEGMAAGIPVVTSDAPALVEVGGDAVRTAPVGDAAALTAALADVVGDTALRDRMVTAGRVRASAQTWDAAAAALVELYSGLI